MPQEPAVMAVICASDLAQLCVCAAEEAGPGERFRLEESELRAILDDIGPERLPANPRAVPPLVTVALGLAHGAAGRDQ